MGSKKKKNKKNERQESLTHSDLSSGFDSIPSLNRAE